MKLIALFILSLLVVSAFGRKHKTQKNKWKDTFKVFIHLRDSKTQNSEPEFEAESKLVDVQDQSNKRKGLYFYNFKTKPTGNLLSLLVRDENAWYIPYRLFNNDWAATHTGITSYDFIKATVTKGGKSWEFKLKVSYNTFSTNDVTYSNLQEWAKLLNTRCADARHEVFNNIQGAESAAQTFKTNKDSAEGVLAGKNGVQSKIDQANKDLAEAMEQEKDLKTKSQDLSHELGAKKLEVSALEQQEVEILTRLVNTGEKIRDLQLIIKDLTAQQNSGKYDPTAFNNEAAKAQNAFNTNLGVLKNRITEYGQGTNLQNAAQKFANLDPQGVKTNLEAVKSRRRHFRRRR